MDSFIVEKQLMFSEHQINVIDLIVRISSSLGMLGSLFMIVTFIIFKEMREFSTKLICFLAVSDFVASLAWFPFTHTTTLPCLMQSVGLQFFLCASFLWTMAISLSLFFAFYSDIIENEWTLKMRYYHAICWGLPLIFVAIMLTIGKYENNGVRCFVNSDSFLSLLFYVPLLIVFIINTSVFIAIRVKLARHKDSLESKINVIVSFYLVAFLASQLPAVLTGMQHFIDPQHPIFALYVVLAVLQPLQGFLNAIVYGLNEGFVAQYIYFFEKYCGRRLRKGASFERDGVDTDNLLTEYNYNSDDE